MTKAPTKAPSVKVLLPVLLLMVIGLLVLIPALQHKNSVTPHNASVPAHVNDDFNRAGGGLGPHWTRISDGGLSIRSHAVTGESGLTGDIWTARTFTSSQYSQIEVTSTQLTGAEWIGTAVRVQHHGRDAYVGVYYWNSGKPELVLFKRNGGNWTQLGAYSSGPLAAGTKLKLVAVGNTISFLENGFPCLTASDRSVSGGAPGIMIFGSGTVGDWTGGAASGTIGFHVRYLSTDTHGVRSYQVFSPGNGPGLQVMRVLVPKHPAPGVPHNFLYVLPVQAQLGGAFNDGLDTVRRLDGQDRYNLTIIEPTFAISPWYADNPKNPNVRYETFMTGEIVPWVEKNLAIAGHEQNWLIGFSKSGLGGQDLILKHPDIFALAASWDFPAGMSSYDGLGAGSSYGTNANFQANYQLTAAFVKTHSGPFLRQNRIWIGGSRVFPTDISDYAKLLAKVGIRFSKETPRSMSHSWDSGWVPDALAALRQDSIELHGSQS
jgi:hypothetical protein